MLIAIPTPPPTTSARRAGSGSCLEFRHTFRCAGDDCPSHDTALRGWEAGEPYRKFLRKYGEADLREQLRERWYERTSAPNRAVHLFLGNIAADPRSGRHPGGTVPPAKGPPHPTSCTAKPKAAAPLLPRNHYSA
ncbi:hypothetical protein GCM10010371_13790 [Streptomyces subrutilus]|uniref:Uncharacterized protein n=1 Tax=Streptomyces subrutilus TaxID=36818 RepID=A0A918QMF9_9ACTN|nr:hypothetical protein [Streptomyces subrutilus]GGZ55535.1 hypothetical protein GCM10010371_13790 [Streptomyces subrutilus]